jgi:hypothetical protein
VKSPDRADSVMLAFALRQDPVDALIDYHLRRLEGDLDPELADQSAASAYDNKSAWKSYERTGIKIQDRLAKLRDRSRSRADALSHLDIQRCRRCAKSPVSMRTQLTTTESRPGTKTAEPEERQRGRFKMRGKKAGNNVPAQFSAQPGPKTTFAASGNGFSYCKPGMP